MHWCYTLELRVSLTLVPLSPRRLTPREEPWYSPSAPPHPHRLGANRSSALTARGRMPRFQAARRIGVTGGAPAESCASARAGRQTASSAAHNPVNAAQDSVASFSTAAFALFLTSASPRGVPAPTVFLIASERLNAPTWISSRFKTFSRPFRCNRRIPPVS